MKMSPRWLLAASLLIATPAVGQEAHQETTAKQPTDEVKTRVETLLSGIEHVPTPQDWSAVGEPAVPVLIEIVRDRNAKIVTRGRAAIGLGYFDTDASKQTLRMMLIDSSTPKLLLRKSIVALVKLEGNGSIDAIAVHLDHGAKRVREQAIKSLGELRTEPARAALGERAKVEPSKYLKDLIATELQKPMLSKKPVTPTESGPEVAKESTQ